MTRLFSDISSAIFDQLVPNSSLARKHLMLIKKNVQGFSLIELMVAVGIMGGMTTLAVPQYGKYKLKAAQTEVKATLANIHGAQELHLVDKNYYSPNLTGIGLHKVVPTVITTTSGEVSANDTGQNFVYGHKKLTAAGASDGNFTTSKDGGTNVANNGKGTDAVEYFMVATAVRKLASCAEAGKLEAWCLNNDKLITNTETNGDKWSGGAARCNTQTEDTKASC